MLRTLFGWLVILCLVAPKATLGAKTDPSIDDLLTKPEYKTLEPGELRTESLEEKAAQWKIVLAIQGKGSSLAYDLAVIKGLMHFLPELFRTQNNEPNKNVVLTGVSGAAIIASVFACYGFEPWIFEAFCSYVLGESQYKDWLCDFENWDEEGHKKALALLKKEIRLEPGTDSATKPASPMNVFREQAENYDLKVLPLIQVIVEHKAGTLKQVNVPASPITLLDPFALPVFQVDSLDQIPNSVCGKNGEFKVPLVLVSANQDVTLNFDQHRTKSSEGSFLDAVGFGADMVKTLEDFKLQKDTVGGRAAAATKLKKTAQTLSSIVKGSAKLFDSTTYNIFWKWSALPGLENHQSTSFGETNYFTVNNPGLKFPSEELRTTLERTFSIPEPGQLQPKNHKGVYIGKACTYFVSKTMFQTLSLIPPEERLCDLRLITSSKDLWEAWKGSAAEPIVLPPVAELDHSKLWVDNIRGSTKEHLNIDSSVRDQVKYWGGVIMGAGAVQDVRRVAPHLHIVGTGTAWNGLPEPVKIAVEAFSIYSLDEIMKYSDYWLDASTVPTTKTMEKAFEREIMPGAEFLGGMVRIWDCFKNDYEAKNEDDRYVCSQGNLWVPARANLRKPIANHLAPEGALTTSEKSDRYNRCTDGASVNEKGFLCRGRGFKALKPIVEQLKKEQSDS